MISALIVFVFLLFTILFSNISLWVNFLFRLLIQFFKSVVCFIDSFFPKLKLAQTSLTVLCNIIVLLTGNLVKLTSPLTTRLYKRVIDFLFFDISRNSDKIKNIFNDLLTLISKVLFVYVFFYLNLWGYIFNYILGDISENFIVWDITTYSGVFLILLSFLNFDNLFLFIYIIFSKLGFSFFLNHNWYENFIAA